MEYLNNIHHAFTKEDPLEDLNISISDIDDINEIDAKLESLINTNIKEVEYATIDASDLKFEVEEIFVIPDEKNLREFNQISNEEFQQELEDNLAEFFNFNPNEDTKLFCETCQWKASSELKLESHLKSIKHLKAQEAMIIEEKHICKYCINISFAKGRMLKDHLKTVHLIYKCEKCKRGFTNQKSYDLHMDRHNSKLTCIICEKTFTTKPNLLRHLKTHTDKIKHKCTICPKTFAQKPNLMRHMKTHKFE